MAQGTVTPINESLTNPSGPSTETTPNLNSMIKRYMPYGLLKMELERQNWFIEKVSKKNDFKGGILEVEFKAAKSTSIRYGKLVPSDKITGPKYAKGLMHGYKEIWGALKFLDHDLAKHDDLKKSFVEALLKEIPDFIISMSDKVSHALLNGASYTRVVGIADAATGVLKIARPEMLEIGQYVEFGADSATVKSSFGYVSSIDMGDENGGDVTFVAAMTDVDAETNKIDFTTVAGNVTTVIASGDGLRLEDGFHTASAALTFTSLPEQLLSLANGGSATLFGVEKKKYPFLQSLNRVVTGATSAQDMLGHLFDMIALNKRMNKTAIVKEVVMSNVVLAKIVKSIELNEMIGATGQKRFTSSDTKYNAFGWTEVTVSALGQSVKFVGINELNDDYMIGIDFTSMDLLTNGMFERRKSPSGNEFYEERSETGFTYIVDIRFFGELVVSQPYKNFIIDISGATIS